MGIKPILKHQPMPAIHMHETLAQSPSEVSLPCLYGRLTQALLKRLTLLELWLVGPVVLQIHHCAAGKGRDKNVSGGYIRRPEALAQHADGYIGLQ